MKKLTTITLLAILSFYLFSCKKENQQLQTSENKSSQVQIDEYNVVVKNNLLVFNTVADYEKVADDQTGKITEDFMQKINILSTFTSLSETRDTIDMPDFLESILNKDMAVQIGKYIYKIDIIKEKVFVLNADFISQYNDLITENTNNEKIKVYSTNDEVITLVEKGNTQREDGIGNKGSDAYLNIIDASGMIRGFKYLYVRFERYGIWFKLYRDNTQTTWIDNSITVSCGFRANFSILKYKLRNSTEYDKSGVYNQDGRYVFYSGTKTLSKLWVRGQFEEVLNYNVVTFATLNPEIRVNY